ncbi:MAG: radical SAM protein, partial [Alphaproteobacteria bacterium]|nr:radical SAM protein [Alphaproteobacteria bacterium]
MPLRLPPRFLFVQVNKACNLRCTHCDFWMRNDDDSANYRPQSRVAEIVEEFSELNPGGAVVICGGEAMLDLGGFFGLSKMARDNGLRCLAVVNGTRIRSPAMAERMIVDGPNEISVSLNSHRAELHDETRGVEGAFEKAVCALKLMLAARRKHPGSKTGIHAMGLIFDENYREIEDFYDFVLNDVGADKLKLNFIQPSFGHDTDNDAFFERHARLDADELVSILNRADRRFGLGYNPVWLEQVGMYFRSLEAAHDLGRGWGSEARTK